MAGKMAAADSGDRLHTLVTKSLSALACRGPKYASRTTPPAPSTPSLMGALPGAAIVCCTGAKVANTPEFVRFGALRTWQNFLMQKERGDRHCCIAQFAPHIPQIGIGHWGRDATVAIAQFFRMGRCHPATALLALLLLPALATAQLSKAAAHDSNLDTTGNKFLQRQASADEHIATGQQ